MTQTKENYEKTRHQQVAKQNSIKRIFVEKKKPVSYKNVKVAPVTLHYVGALITVTLQTAV